MGNCGKRVSEVKNVPIFSDSTIPYPGKRPNSILGQLINYFEYYPHSNAVWFFRLPGTDVFATRALGITS